MFSMEDSEKNTDSRLDIYIYRRWTIGEKKIQLR